MPNYMHVASGTINSSFQWSFTAKSTSAATESAAETAWNAGISAMFNSAGFNAVLPATVELTETSTSTASADWKQTTKTSTTLAIVGTGTQALPYQVAEVVTLRSDQATKYGRGRWFLPCLTTASLATGGYVLASTTQADIVTAVNAAFAAWSGTLQLVILHRKGSLNGAVAAYSTSVVASGDVANKLVIQKRRADKSAVVRSAITV